MQGFIAREGNEIAVVDIAAPARDRLRRMFVAITLGATPEEIAVALDTDEWGDAVLAVLAQPLVSDEMDALVDCVAGVLRGD